MTRKANKQEVILNKESVLTVVPVQTKQFYSQTVEVEKEVADWIVAFERQRSLFNTWCADTHYASGRKNMALPAFPEELLSAEKKPAKKGRPASVSKQLRESDSGDAEQPAGKV